MGRTLKDSFRFNRYSTYRQEEDRECFYTLCPLFFASTAFVVTNAIFNCRYAVASLGSIYLPCGKFDMLSLRSSSI